METEIEAPDAGRDDHVIKRAYANAVTAGDGRTIDVCIVPYGETIEHNDGLGGVPKGVAYREQWAPGSFNDQTVAGHRLKVFMNFEYERGVANLVGKGIALREQPDGLHGTFRALDNEAGSTALELVKDGILDGVSVEARPKKSVRTHDGIVRRVRAHLVNVALCRDPAYSGARVIAVREEANPIFDEELLPLEIDPELVARCERLGIALPERMKAHPAPDTPAQPGTPEDGTRQDGDHTDLEA